MNSHPIGFDLGVDEKICQAGHQLRRDKPDSQVELIVALFKVNLVHEVHMRGIMKTKEPMAPIGLGGAGASPAIFWETAAANFIRDRFVLYGFPILFL